MPVKMFVFSEKGSQTEISLLHFPLQRKMRLGRCSPLALLSLGVIVVLQRLERVNAPLQPSSHTAWRGFKMPLGGDSPSPFVFVGIPNFKGAVQPALGWVVEPGVGCSGGHFSLPWYNEMGRGLP